MGWKSWDTAPLPELGTQGPMPAGLSSLPVGTLGQNQQRLQTFTLTPLNGPTPFSRKPLLHQVGRLPPSCGLHYLGHCVGLLASSPLDLHEHPGICLSLVCRAHTRPGPLHEAWIKVNSMHGGQGLRTPKGPLGPTWQGCCIDPPGLLPSPHSLRAPASAAGQTLLAPTGPGFGEGLDQWGSGPGHV